MTQLLPGLALTLVLCIVAVAYADEHGDSGQLRDTIDGDADDTTPADPGENASPATTDVSIVVVNSRTGDAVEGAKVIIRPVTGSISFEQRTDTTNEDGVCMVGAMPRGEIKVFVTAKHMSSFRKQFEVGAGIDGQQTIRIKLELSVDEPAAAADDPD